ncbi:DNA primase [Kangiella profundi]|uniref:DNA primase n=1 Tax=Kangiella profundi TaxID=1561924 RepID=A0A2K9APP0_9GAMM|nr:DNA primase [Kangiella profundi]AUD79592.1 DNA primase [Kangiella profundi]GGE97132.1 DNA primase [Kangiella profundi]
MGLIPQHFIHELLARVDIVDLIDSRVPLKKAGANYKACCPFHGEKTPSFTVSQDKQFYHCFGCGVHGNAIGFLMEYDRLEFPDAVEELAAMMGMEVPREETVSNAPKVDTSLYDIMEKAANYYQQQLKSNKSAIEYLKGRGLSGEIAKQFAIGYVPGEWRNLEAIFPKLQQDKKLQQQLVECGLMIRKDSSLYDRFRDRIMFPIKDKRGRVIAFGGRVMGQGEPKYLNSPETPIFHKSNELYGLYQARQANRKLSRLLIVEGYMDVVALAQFGINYAVATLGTATTASHLQQLFRTTRELVLCFDGDRAGRDAALRAIEHGLPQMREGREIRLMFLPDGEDPDSMVRKVGKEQFEEMIGKATPLFEFILEHLSAQVDLSSVSGRGQLVHLAKPYLDKITDPIYHEFFSSALSEKAKLSESKLAAIIEAPTQSQPSRKPTQSKPQSTKTNKTLQLAITLLLQQPSLALNLKNYDWLLTLPDKGSKLLHQLLEIIHKTPKINTSLLLENWRDNPKLYDRLASLAMTEREERIQGQEQQELQDCVNRLLLHARKIRVDYLQQKAAEHGLTNQEKSEYRQLLLLAKQGSNGNSAK